MPAEPEPSQNEPTPAPEEPPQDPSPPASAPDQADEWALPAKKSKKKKGKKGVSTDAVEPVIEEQALEQAAAEKSLSEPLTREGGTDVPPSSLPAEVVETTPGGMSKEIPVDAADDDKKHAPDANATVPEGSEMKDVSTDLAEPPSAEDIPTATDELAEAQLPVPSVEDLAEPALQIHGPAMEEATKSTPSEEPIPEAEASPHPADHPPEEPLVAERNEPTQEPSPTDDVAASFTSKKDKKKKKGKKSKASADMDAAEPAESSITLDKPVAEAPLTPAPVESTEQLENTKDLPKETPVETEHSEQQTEPEELVPETTEPTPADVQEVEQDDLALSSKKRSKKGKKRDKATSEAATTPAPSRPLSPAADELAASSDKPSEEVISAEPSVEPEKPAEEQPIEAAPEPEKPSGETTPEVSTEAPGEPEQPSHEFSAEAAATEDLPTADIDPVSGEQDKSREPPPAPAEAALEPEISVEAPAGAAEVITEPTRDEKPAAGKDRADEWDLPSTKKGKKRKDKKRGKSISDAIAEDPEPTPPADSTPQNVQEPSPSEPAQMEVEPAPLEAAKPDEPEPTVEEPSSAKSKKKKGKKGKERTSEATTPAISRPESPVNEKRSAPAADVAQEPPIVNVAIAASPEAVEGDKQESEPVPGAAEPETARAVPAEQEPEVDSAVKPKDQLTVEENTISEPDTPITHQPEAEPAVQPEAEGIVLAAEPSIVPAPEPEAEPIVDHETHVPAEDTTDLGLNVSKKKGKKNKKKGQSASDTPVVSRPLSPVNDDPPAPVSEGHDVSVSGTPAAEDSAEPTKDKPVATEQYPDDWGFASKKKKGKKGTKREEPSGTPTPAAPRAISPGMDEPSRDQEAIADQTRAVQIDITPEAAAPVEEEVKDLASTTEKEVKKREQADSDTTTPTMSRALSPTLEAEAESPLPATTETQQVEDEWALPSKKKGKKKAKKAKTEQDAIEQSSDQPGQPSLPEEVPSEPTRQLVPLLKFEPDATPSDALDPETPTEFPSQAVRSTPASPIETRETRLIPAQTTSHITHEAPSGEVARPEKKLKTDDMDALMLSEPVMSIEEPVTDVSPEPQEAQKESTLDKGKDVDVSFARDIDDAPQEIESRGDETKAVAEGSTAIGAAAAAAAEVAALAGKSKKKGKKKKVNDERREREGVLFDDPLLGESDGREALTGGEENAHDGNTGGEGADWGGLEVAGDAHAVPMEIERGMGEIEKVEDVVMPAVVEEAGVDVVKSDPEERMATPEVVDQTVPVVVEEPVTGVEGRESADEVKSDALEPERTRGLIEEGNVVEKGPEVPQANVRSPWASRRVEDVDFDVAMEATPKPVNEAKPESTVEVEPAPIAPRTPEMAKTVPAESETTRGIPEATPEPIGERALSSAERALSMPNVTGQPTLRQETRGLTKLAPAWGEPEESPVLGRGGVQRGRSFGGETSPIPPVTPTRDLTSPDNSLRGLTGDTLDSSPFSPLRRSSSRNLEPVPEHPAETLDPPSEARERRPKKLPISAPDNTRDSGLVTDSPRLGQRSRWQQEGPHRDSGVHLKEWADAPRQISPSPSGPRSMEPFKTPETSERRLKRSPRSTKELREQEGPTSKTPVLRGPSPQAPTPEPQKSLRDYKTPDNLRGKYQDLGTPSLPAKKPSQPGPARASALPRPSTRSPAPSQRSVSDNVSRSRLTPSPDTAPRRVASNTSFTRHRTPEPPRLRPDTPGSIRSLHSATPPLRRAGRRISGDLRSISLSQRDQAEAPPATDSSDEHRSAQTSTPVANEGPVRSKDMTDVYVSRRD